MIFCFVALGVFLTATNPEHISIGLLVVPVVLLFLIAFCAAQLIMTSLKILKKEPRRRRTVALMSASLLSVIMILKSTGGISVVDVVLLALIIGVAGIYISKF